tara:strand:- start:37364 stop:37609 length:246 start_codon:yes stop_codon:yes gene_type:complete
MRAKLIVWHVSFCTPLFDPEAFHSKNYTESPNNVCISFINKKPHLSTGFGAGLTRLELATSGLTGRRSNQLNYSPISKNIY